MKLISALFLLASFASCGIIPLDNVNLLPFQFTYHYRYVFSDREDEEHSEDIPLKRASAHINFKIKYFNPDTKEHRLFIVLGERD